MNMGVDHEHYCDEVRHDPSLTPSQGIAVPPIVTDDWPSETFSMNVPAQVLQAGDATRTNHIRSHTLAGLGQQRSEPGRPDQESSICHQEQMTMTPDHSNRTSSTTCSSTATAETGRSSVSSEPGLPGPKKYMCPICNMGYGHGKRHYSKGGSMTPRSIETPSSGARVPVFKCHWDRRQFFDDHIRDFHIDIFQSEWEDCVYICRLCPCNTLDFSVNCGAAFPSEELIVDHLATKHANNLESLRMYTHLCGCIAPGQPEAWG